MSPEILARLGPEVVALDSWGRGGAPELTPLDVAAALAGLPPGPYALARLAWVEDWSFHPELVRALAGRVSPPRRPEQLATWPKVLAAAIAEYCCTRCEECEGRGVVARAPAPAACPACNGSGGARWGEQRRAAELGVSRGEWWRWRWPYERAYRCVAAWGSEVMSHLHWRLREEEA